VSDDHFSVEIGGRSRADIFLVCADGDTSIWPLVRQFDQAGVCVVGDVPGSGSAANRAVTIASACDGTVAVLSSTESSAEELAQIRAHVDRARETGQPSLVVHPDDDEARVRVGIENVIEQAAGRSAAARPYAFFIGRLERDFSHARAAIRAAVEREAGIACLWSDSDHQTNVVSVRESTRLLIKNAAFVIADLTLGVENPHGENPSRAHEIGMSIAYERPLMLSSQEPRRYPYFSIGDMQMTFWETEAHLYESVRHWIRARRGGLARTVFNHHLPERFPGYQAVIGAPNFNYDPALRYVGPWTPVPDAERIGR
jgi:hypothetical protein